MQMLNEAPPNNTGLENMSVPQLIALAEQLGVDIDKRMPHHEMLVELQEILILTKMYG
jgi:hypothetical protein